MEAHCRLTKVVASFCFLSLTISILYAYMTSATGFESSLYNSTPSLVWYLLFIGIIGGVYIIIRQVIINRSKDPLPLLIGFSILLTARAILLLLPYIRGYMAWAGDHLTHVGYIKDILEMGALTPTNYYPITHLLSASIVSVTAIDALSVNMFTVLLSIGFVVSTYMLATVIFSNRNQHVLAALLAGTVFLGGGYNVFLMPNGWSILFLPFALYLYIKSNQFYYRALFLLILIIYPLFHPLSALVLIVFIALLELSKRAFTWLFNRDASSILEASNKPSLPIVLIGSISLISWVISFDQFIWMFRRIRRQLTIGLGSNPMGEIGKSLEKVSVSGFDFIALLINLYGTFILLFIISSLGLFFILRSVRAYGMNPKETNYLKLFSIFLLTCMLYGAYLVGIPGLSEISGGRLLTYAEILVPTIAAPTIFLMSKQKKVPIRLIAIGVVSLIVLASVVSFVSLYPSPQVYKPNPQITCSDFVGMDWFIEAKDESVPSIYLYSQPYRMADAILGVTPTDTRSDFSMYPKRVPDHFGYVKNDTLGEQIGSNMYFPLPYIDKILYSSVWESVGRFDDKDFDQLCQDQSVSKLYSNREFGVYSIMAQ